MSEPVQPPWWGAFTIPVGRGGRLRVGPTTLTFQHLRREWLIARERDGADDRRVEVEVPCDVGDVLAIDDMVRFGTASDSDQLTVTPALADRAVVARPERPFSVVAGDAVTIYVGTPLWAQFRLGDGRALLHELPIIRPSDTWFGPSPREGELCYASRTYCRLDPAYSLPTPMRARTAVHIANHTAAPLLIERIKVPVRFLSLYRADDGSLWTESIRLDNRGAAEPVPLELGAAGPARPGSAPVATPRDPDRANLVERAFHLLVRYSG